MPVGRFVSRRRGATAAALGAAVLALAACAEAEPDVGGDALRSEDDAERETAAPFDAGEEVCERERAGVTYRVAYPADWWTDDGDQACRMFHPEPYDMPEQPQDVPGMAVVFDVIDQPIEEATEPHAAEVRSEEKTTVDGRTAIVQETELTEETLFPEGTRIARHLVDVDGRTLVASTTDHASAGEYDHNRAALAGMIEQLEISDVRDPDQPDDRDDARDTGWQALPAAPIEARTAPVVADVGGEVVVWGGAPDADSASPTGAAFDPSEREWRDVPEGPASGPFGAAFVTGGDELFVTGGSEAPGARDCDQRAAIYHAGHDRWQELPGHGLGERCAPALAHDGERFHLWGGARVPHSAPEEAYADGATYDPAAGEWEPIPEAPIGGRYGAEAVATSEKLIVVGGSEVPARPRVEAAAYEFEAGEWRELAPLPIEPRANMAAGVVGDELILAGGGTAEEPHRDGAALSLAEESWRDLGDELPGRHVAPASAAGVDELVVVGGDAGAEPHGAVAYDPARDAWEALPQLPGGHRRHHGAVHTGDEVVVWGGELGGDAPAGAMLPR